MQAGRVPDRVVPGSSPLVEQHRSYLVTRVGLSAVLSLAAGLGMLEIAGTAAIRTRLADAHWWWMAPATGAVLLAFAGYFMAYRGLYLAEDGPPMPNRKLLAVVVTGFGGLLAHGAGRFDASILRARGMSERDAKVRVTALAGFEHGVLAVVVCPAAIAALLLGVVIPRTDLTWSWAIAPVPGFLIAASLAERFRDRLRDRRGIAGRIGIFLDAVHLAVELFRHPARNQFAVLGMALYWCGDMLALWMTTAAFGVRMRALAVIVALGTGMIATRRTAPLGGAGLLMVALVPTVWYGAAVPFAVATLGVAAYRILTLWLPLPGALIALPVIRAIGPTTDTPRPTQALAAVAEADR